MVKKADAPKAEKPTAPMTDVHRKQRGQALDDLQQRIADLKGLGKAIPDDWRDKMRALAEAHDPDVIDAIVMWMQTDLPPKEYMTEEITWQTFAHFSTALLDRLTIFAARKLILDGAPDSGARSLMVELLAIKSATDSPVVAMSELAKVRARAVALPLFAEGV